MWPWNKNPVSPDSQHFRKKRKTALSWDYSMDFISLNFAGFPGSAEPELHKREKTCLVPCTWKWHPINSNRILLGLAASAGVGHSLNPESSPPSLLKALSLMTLQRWEKVAAQKGLESKGGIDPGTRPSFLSLPLLLPPPPLLLFSPVSSPSPLSVCSRFPLLLSPSF